MLTDGRTDGRTHGRTDDGRKVITIVHPEHSSGELIKEHKNTRKIRNIWEKELKLEFFHLVNKSWFISLFHKKETEHMIKTAGKVISYRYSSRDLLD